MAEKYVKVVQDMNEGSVTVLRYVVGVMDVSTVEVGLHQGLALTHFLFVMVMDRLTHEIGGPMDYDVCYSSV